MWGEIAVARRNSRIAFPEPTATELKLGDKRYAVGLSTNDPNKFQSYHAAHVLIIADEAQGILNAIWEAVEGIRAGGDVRVLMQGNPTVTGGHYQDVCPPCRRRNLALLQDGLIGAARRGETPGEG